MDVSEVHSEASDSVNSNCPFDSATITVDESGNTELLQRWRDYVRKARTGGQIMFALQVSFESSITVRTNQIFHIDTFSLHGDFSVFHTGHIFPLLLIILIYENKDVNDSLLSKNNWYSFRDSRKV